jgi:hypothetical protein
LAAAEAIVTVRAYADGELVSTGSGFFVRNDGVIVTNMHVVVDGDTLEIELADGEVFDDVYVLSGDDKRDLIVLQVSTAGTPVLQVADDREVRIGDPVYVLGNPLGLRGTFSDGIVSGKRNEDGVNYLQVTAPISMGSSGGPVLNSDGDVIGVATAYLEGGQNLNLAIPARHAMGLLTMANEPVLFDSIVAEISADQESLPAESRSSQTANIMAALPPDMQSSMQSLSEYERQATVRMLAFAAIVMDEGYEFIDYSVSGTLESDGADGETFTLSRGNYFAVGSCDNDCVDLDVVVLDEEGNIVAEDRKVDADSAVAFEVQAQDQFIIGAHMVNCSATDCVYYVQLFKKK